MEKLKLVLQYLRGTIDLVLTLGADDITKMKLWVDVLYKIHSEYKIHTVGGRGDVLGVGRTFEQVPETTF